MRLVTSRCTVRALSPKVGLDLLPGDGAVLGDLSASDVGGLVTKKRLSLPLSPSLAAVASDLRDHSRNNDDPHDVAPAPVDTTPEHHSPPSTPPPITTTLQL